jgi:hypothetical protein
MMGDLRPVLETTARAKELYRPERHHAHVTKFGTGHDSGICGFGHGATARILAGQPTAGEVWLHDTAALISRIDHPFSRCVGLTHIAFANDLLGDYDAVIAAADEALTIAGAHGFRMPLGLATMLRGGALLARGDADDGRRVLRALFDGPPSGVPANWAPMFLARLARAEDAAGDADAGEAYLARAESTVASLDGCVAEAEVYRARAAMLHAHGAARATVDERLATAALSADRAGAGLLRERIAADRVRMFASASLSR